MLFSIATVFRVAFTMLAKTKTATKKLNTYLVKVEEKTRIKKLRCI